MDKVILQRLLVMLALFFGTMSATSAANSFYMEPTAVKQGETTVKLQFMLENETPFYGFQMDIQLPSGLEFVEVNGNPDITLSSRAADGDYKTVSNFVSAQKVTLGTFSANHKPFTGSDGVLFTANVKVNTGFIGGNVELNNVTFVNADDTDESLAASSAEVDVIVPVTGITLSETEWRGIEGSSVQLTANVAPTNATNKGVTWTSSDPSIATVSADGIVTAVKAGSTVITATAADGSGIKATCNITVTTQNTPVPDYQEASKVRIGKLLYNLHSDGTASVTYEVYDTHENYKGLGYVELPETVEYNGLKYTVTEIGDHAFNRADITGIKISSTVTRIGESSISDITNHIDKIVVPDNVTVIGVNAFIGTDMDEIVIGDGVTLIQQGAFAFTPTLLKVTLGTGLQTIDSEGFNSENIQIVVSYATTPPTLQGYAPFSYSVFENAILYVPAASVELYRNDSNWGQFKNIYAISEEPVQPESVSLSPERYDIQYGEEYVITATVSPENAFGYKLVWTSSDENVATVDADGIVRGVGAGEAVITVTIEGAELMAQALVSVSAQSGDDEEAVRIGDLFYILHPEDNTAEVTYQYYRNDDNYSYLGSEVVVPQNVEYDGVEYTITYIGLAAFNRLKTLKAIKLPPTILGIRLDGLCETGLRSVEIGDACEFLGYGTCAWSYDLKEIVIGSSMKEIGGESFWQSDLDKVTCKASTPPSLTSDWMPVFNDTTHENAILYVPAESVELYHNDPYWGQFRNIRAIGDETDPDVVLATSLTLDCTSRDVVKGDEFILIATVLPDDTTNPQLEWSSSDDSIATVDNEGKVKVLKSAPCVITVRTTDGSDLSAMCELKLSGGIEEILINETDGKFDVYTVTGILIIRHGTLDDFRGLAPGYYIINRRKIYKGL